MCTDLVAACIWPGCRSWRISRKTVHLWAAWPSDLRTEPSVPPSDTHTAALLTHCCTYSGRSETHTCTTLYVIQCVQIYTTVQNFRVGKMLLKEVFYTYQGSIYLIKNTGKLWKIITTILKYCTFSASWLQSSVSHDPSEIILICWFAAQETFLIHFIFLDSLMNRELKKTAFIWT